MHKLRLQGCIYMEASPSLVNSITSAFSVRCMGDNNLSMCNINRWKTVQVTLWNWLQLFCLLAEEMTNALQWQSSNYWRWFWTLFPDLQDNSSLKSYLDRIEGCCAFLIHSLSRHGLSKDFAYHACNTERRCRLQKYPILYLNLKDSLL